MTDLPEAEGLKHEIEDGVFRLWFDRPEAKNALSNDMVEGVQKIARLLPERGDLRAVVLRGSGGAFCAGADLKTFSQSFATPAPTDGSPDPILAMNRGFGTMLQLLDAIPQTLIVGVEGPSFGGSLGIISVSDVAIAAADAKFALSETSLGIPPAQIGPYVVRRIGLSHARRLSLTGSRFGADEALRVGFVHEAVADATALEGSIEAALKGVSRCAPGANGVTKELFTLSAHAIDGAILDEAAVMFRDCLRGPEAAEGVGAFLEKRKPSWTGE
ncbi:MAG: enoyl-CoA hydratase-related protein [Pseudomonadota bacterium]